MRKIRSYLIVLLLIAALSPSQAAYTPVSRPTVVPIPPITTGQPERPGVNALPLRKEMPDPLASTDGRRITTAADWEKHRAEIKALLMYYSTGFIPPAPGNVAGRVLADEKLLDGSVRYRLVRLTFGPNQSLGLDFALFTPTDKPGPFPTVIFPTFTPTPGGEPLPLLPRHPLQGKGLDALAMPLGIPEEFVAAKPPAPVTPEKFVVEHRDVFVRGYAIATFNYQDAGEDSIVRNTDGSWAFRNSRFFPAYPQYDWGLLGSWAWGISRCIDFLETQPEIDRTRFIAAGHSRIGKAVLVAGAFDERIAVSAPVGSAGGGVGAYRHSGFGRNGGEGIDDMMRKYPNWFSPHLREFGPAADKLPFDQHWFVALTAPRAFIAIDGNADRICSPTAVRASLRAAEPVYALYGAAEKIGLHYGEHGHAFNAADWAALLDFADWHLRGQKPTRSFGVGSPDAKPLVLDVRKLGAAGDGRTKDTEVFQRAFDRCFAAGGGEVMVPAGEYLIGAVQLRARTTLRLEEGSVLRGSPDLADYPIERIRWEGQWEDGHRALINAADADQIAIVGLGHIAGAETLGRQRNPRAPALIETIHCDGVRFEGFSTTYANMWCIHPTRCRNIVARNLRVRSGGGNGDGLDIDSCKNVLIEHCDIMTGDDPIALKSGRGLEGYLAGEATEDVTIRHCTLGDSNWACIGIGSEMSGGIRNVRIEHCTFVHSRTSGIYIKGRPGRGGVIENIVVDDVNVLSADGAVLRINLLNSGKEGSDPVPGDEGVPLGRNFRFSNIRFVGAGRVTEMTVPATKPVEGLVLENWAGSAKNGLQLENVKGIELRNISVKVAEGPVLKAEGVTGAGLEDELGTSAKP
ncbi:MAG: glycoside hydrolase family 28 protein [Nibricoccus sp.]